MRVQLAMVAGVMAAMATSSHAVAPVEGREVGNGGDGCELVVAALSWELVEDLRGPLGKHFPEIDVPALEEAVRTATVECVDEAKVGDRAREAVNYPSSKLIRPTRKRFGREVNRVIQKPLLLHEYLPLLKISDAGYAISRRLVTLLSLGATPEFVFDLEGFEEGLDEIIRQAAQRADEKLRPTMEGLGLSRQEMIDLIPGPYSTKLCEGEDSPFTRHCLRTLLSRTGVRLDATRPQRNAPSSAPALIQCENLSEDFFEDTLTIDPVSKTATYFDNDYHYPLECAFLNSVILCGDRRFTVKLQENGDAVVYEGNGPKPNVIPFSCKMPLK